MFGPHVHRIFAGEGAALPEHLAADRAGAAEAGIEMRAAQIFVASPRKLAMTLGDTEAAALKAYLEREPLFVVAHGTYLDVPWKSAYIRKFIRKEIEACEAAGVRGLVVHLGTPGVAEVVGALPSLVEPWRDVIVYLETPHVKPEKSLYETGAKLAALFREIRSRADPNLCRFGLCVDTAHLWACGVDLRGRAEAEAWLAGLEAVSGVIPHDRILFHLNDNHAGRGSGGDHHACLFEGQIWGDYVDRPAASGLAAFVEYAVRWQLPVILERNAPAAARAAGGATALEGLEAALASDYNTLYGLTEAARPKLNPGAQEAARP